jgi:hypothetical protein
MKNIKQMVFLVIYLIALLVVGCSRENINGKNVNGRFDIINEFYLFDGSEYGNKGKILKDRKTGKCYLYVWGGSGNGGPAITTIVCK